MYMYASWEISHGVACLSARELDIYSRGNRLPFRLWSNEIGGVLERIQRQFRGVCTVFVDGNFDVSMDKGI